jgi:hypothetical protein
MTRVDLVRHSGAHGWQSLREGSLAFGAMTVA